MKNTSPSLAIHHKKPEDIDKCHKNSRPASSSSHISNQCSHINVFLAHHVPGQPGHLFYNSGSLFQTLCGSSLLLDLGWSHLHEWQPWAAEVEVCTSTRALYVQSLFSPRTLRVASAKLTNRSPIQVSANGRSFSTGSVI